MEPTPPRKNLREEQKLLTHRRLLDAAVTVFTEKPFLDARMEDIAQAAGVTRATVYAHFPGKAEIVDALVERVYGVMGEAYADLAALPRWTRADIRTWLDDAADRWREMAPLRRVANAAAPAALRVWVRAACSTSRRTSGTSRCWSLRRSGGRASTRRRLASAR